MGKAFEERIKERGKGGQRYKRGVMKEKEKREEEARRGKKGGRILEVVPILVRERQKVTEGWRI